MTSDTCPDCGETTPPEDTHPAPAGTLICGYRCGTCGAMWETAWWAPRPPDAE